MLALLKPYVEAITLINAMDGNGQGRLRLWMATAGLKIRWLHRCEKKKKQLYIYI